MRVMVTGGAGYVGSVLCPLLAKIGHDVTILDNLDYGLWIKKDDRIKVKVKDIRNVRVSDFEGFDAVIHLACISNDPCLELDHALGHEVNYLCFEPLIDRCKVAGVKRFIYASTSAVYGVTDPGIDATEDMECNPITDYARYKLACEPIAMDLADKNFCVTIVRPVTICGVSPRMRFDVVVNILTNHAYNTGRIKVLGDGSNMRGNMHIQDMCDCYAMLLTTPVDKINRQVFNVGLENHTILQLAEMVKCFIDKPVEIYHEPDTDPRSYHLNADKITKVLGWKPAHTIEEAIRDILEGFRFGEFPNSMNDPRYFNIKTMLLRERETQVVRSVN